ncbi:dinitrogenase iron-molybdenum cofactor biosynthesis protein [Oryzomonas sagensis]|uniref:Dinitrogenase iron-molybdenum cofactor biosynthesis protein n=1 Tax=Oryzomonas sagensis TaxID=2603857 RepID=A0ABQ6TKQ0_9BACT|nr:NifB/NifX family molybdenum-iron cluster-binding protein [Oryzomonas sagensis]KAB0668727.1 dinitrogenase iron-molybdenum cofactor biosynthesis protein [Oryzomonas sagensis]
MDVKIAVASSDGTTINEHFGRARAFRIYRLHDEGHEFLELRKNTPACGGQQHDDDVLDRAAQLIADCRGVVAAQVGPGAIDALIGHRILAFTMGGLIDEALETLRASKRFTYIK